MAWPIGGAPVLAHDPKQSVATNVRDLPLGEGAARRPGRSAPLHPESWPDAADP